MTKFPRPCVVVIEQEYDRLHYYEPCMICWTKPPSHVYEAFSHGYQGWIGLLWPLCDDHYAEVNALGWRLFLAKYSINANNKPDI